MACKRHDRLVHAGIEISASYTLHKNQPRGKKQELTLCNFLSLQIISTSAALLLRISAALLMTVSDFKKKCNCRVSCRERGRLRQDGWWQGGRGRMGGGGALALRGLENIG
jgi:hypothetical protein